MKRYSYCGLFSLSAIFLLNALSSEAFGSLGFIKRGFKHCTGVCDQQSQVCKDPKLAEWCRQNCAHKADQNGRMMDGQCFEVTKHNAKQNATRVTSKFAREQLDHCNARVTESKTFSAFMRGIPDASLKTTALTKLLGQLEGIVRDHGAPLSSKVNEVDQMTGAKLQKYSGDLISYIQGCNKLNDKIGDFAYWSMGKTPVGGFKTVQPGSTKAQIDSIFQKVLNENK